MKETVKAEKMPHKIDFSKYPRHEASEDWPNADRFKNAMQRLGLRQSIVVEMLKQELDYDMHPSALSNAINRKLATKTQQLNLDLFLDAMEEQIKIENGGQVP